jgi:hypothetical protein
MRQTASTAARVASPPLTLAPAPGSSLVARVLLALDLGAEPLLALAGLRRQVLAELVRLEQASWKRGG